VTYGAFRLKRHDVAITRDTTLSRSTATTARSFCIVSSSNLRAAATKPVGVSATGAGAATGDAGAIWSSAAAKACGQAANAAAHTATGITVRDFSNAAMRWRECMGQKHRDDGRTARNAAAARFGTVERSCWTAAKDVNA